MGLESKAPVEGSRVRVLSLDLKLVRTDSEFSQEAFDEKNGSAPDALPAHPLPQIELCNGRDSTAEFQVETEGQDEVADIRAAPLDEPNAAEGGVRNEIVESAADRDRIEGDTVEIVVGPDEVDERVDLTGASADELNLES